MASSIASTMALCRARSGLLLLGMALLPLGMAMDAIGSNCAGTRYAGSGKANIDSVLADLVAKGSSGGFATAVAGKGNSAVVYGLAQCRGDVSASDCSSCLADAAKQLPTACSYLSDARIWYDFCFMRYDDTDFAGQSDMGAGVILVNVQAADDPKPFKKAVGKVMNKATAQASASGRAGLGRSKDQYTPFVTIYGLAQCTRDLAPLACAQCVSVALSKFGDYCGAQQGCQINYSSCRVRYEIYPFYIPLDGAGGRATTDMTKYTKIVVHA
ncbi:cysteine-rich repeat secretory protein 55-like isoform X2 [Triticum dicoccoides]|uniref:cysteine-rich repeat secretory protein 55-like isoform X2 n=1 Tax=Triticum dicoccoides TaxID=85692 RepID=UPI000E7C570A|nr:cysteine-rich repeat secretory protein 55-like isoform X2 [Triticum dicoccoides]